jgi:ribosomal protein S18 acetylase RimI-like enzyme
MNNKIKIEPALSEIQLNHLRELLSEYGAMRNHDCALGDFQTELKELGKYYARPKSCLLIAYFDGNPVGCVAFRPLNIDNKTCEMKRMYVRDKFKGKKIGKALAQEIMTWARESGYEKMKLDTHPSMKIAQKMYISLGFKEIPRYNHNPTKGIRFFEINLIQSK